MSGDLEVRLYGRHEDGGFETLAGFGTNHFEHGPLPSLGDIIVLNEGDFGKSYFLVVRRLLITTLFQPEGWALLVEPLSGDGDHDEIARQWAEDTKFFSRDRDESVEEEHPKERVWPPVETIDDLDRDNRDPTYWTFERKEILRKEREARLAAIQAEEKRSKEKRE